MRICRHRPQTKGRGVHDGEGRLRKSLADGVIVTWEVPDHYVVVKEIPKTSVGKIDKKVLRSRYPSAPEA